MGERPYFEKEGSPCPPRRSLYDRIRPQRLFRTAQTTGGGRTIDNDHLKVHWRPANGRSLLNVISLQNYTFGGVELLRQSFQDHIALVRSTNEDHFAVFRRIRGHEVVLTNLRKSTQSHPHRDWTSERPAQQTAAAWSPMHQSDQELLPSTCIHGPCDSSNVFLVTPFPTGGCRKSFLCRSPAGHSRDDATVSRRATRGKSSSKSKHRELVESPVSDSRV